MESLIQAGQELGLSPDLARDLVLQTALGAACMAMDTDQDVGSMRRMVTSPHGTTEAAISHFQSHGLAELVQGAAKAAQERGHEIGKELGEQ